MLHDGAAALFRVIIAHDLAGVPGKALRIVVGVQVGIGDGRDWHRDTVPIGIEGSAGYMPILRPLLLQI